MKKICYVLFSTVFLLACNQSANKNEPIENTTNGPAETSGLALNNGAKWKADSTTNHNVINLKTIADNFRIKPFPALNDYQILENDLTKGLNQMISECRMTGPDHDALHHWLEPVLEENKQLKNISDTSDARRIFETIDQRLDNYHNYFE